MSTNTDVEIQDRFVNYILKSSKVRISFIYLLGGKKTLGTVTLGHRHFFPANNTALSAAGLDHWHDMEHRPGMEIDRWHFL